MTETALEPVTVLKVCFKNASMSEDSKNVNNMLRPGYGTAILLILQNGT